MITSARMMGMGGAGGGHATNISEEEGGGEGGEAAVAGAVPPVVDETTGEAGPGPRVPSHAMVAICVIATAASARARTKMRRIMRLIMASVGPGGRGCGCLPSGSAFELKKLAGGARGPRGVVSPPFSTSPPPISFMRAPWFGVIGSCAGQLMVPGLPA